jgi:hypothetical protein
MCRSKHNCVNTSDRGGNSSGLRLGSQSLRLCHWNIEGIQSKTGVKSTDPDFLKEVNNFDIITLSETHVTKGHSFQIEGFCDPFEGIRCKHPKARKGSGGVAILVKQAIRNGVAFHQSNSPDLIWVQLKKSFFGCTDDIFIGVAYVSPINSTYSLRQDVPVWDTLALEVDKYQQKGKVILVGDLNTRTGSLPDFIQNDDEQFTPVPDSYLPDDTLIINERHNSDNTCRPNDYTDSLLSLCKSTGLRILNGRVIGDLSGNLTCHKWNGSSQVDYGIVHHSLLPLIRFFRVHDYFSDLSDHCKISMCLQIPCPPQKDNTELHCLPPRYKWSDHSVNTFKSGLADRLLTSELHTQLSDTNSDGINSLVDNITGFLVSAANSANQCPDLHRISKARSKPKNRTRPKKWFDTDCHSMRRLLKSLGSNMIKDPRNPHTRGLFFRKRKEYKALLKKKARHYKANLLEALENMATTNPKEYWKLVEELRNTGNEDKSSTSCAPTERLMSHYNNLLHNPDASDPNLRDTIDNLKAEPFFASTDFHITEKEVIDKISKLKLGKAPGLDQIDGTLLKASIPTMVPIYTKLFNLIYNKGQYPEAWNMGYIVNIHKGGTTEDPSNYRGITVNSSLAKVFCMILNDRLDHYITDHNLITPRQIGFKKLARTSDHMFIIRTLLDKYVQNGSPLYACFIDFRKAFDNVWREALLCKLLQANIRGKLFNIIENMYRCDQACLKIGQQRSQFFPCNVGVKQGDVLSPNLFNLFINDLPDFLSGDTTAPVLGDTTIDSLLYADDLVIFSLSSAGLQQSLSNLDRYCQTWRLAVNLDKTKVIKFCKSGRLCTDVFMLDGHQVECVKAYKYLGVVFSASGSMSTARQNIHDRARKALFKLNSCTRDSAVSPALALKLFDQLIKPICLYGAEIWGTEDLSANKFKKENGFEKAYYPLPIEKVHTSFCKYTLGVTKKATNSAVMGELGRFPLGMDVIAAILNFWSHATGDYNNPLLDEAIAESINLNSRGINSWFSFLSGVCNMLGEQIPSSAASSVSIIEKLKSRYVYYWKKYLLGDPQSPTAGKLSSYRMYKTVFGFEDYLSDIRITKHRRALSKLRISNHSLLIETGRYTIPITHRDLRCCPMCQPTDIVEDEIHFLLFCPTFSHIRDALIWANIGDNIKALSPENQIIYLVNSGGNTIKHVANYIYQAFELRYQVTAMPSNSTTAPTARRIACPSLLS